MHEVVRRVGERSTIWVPFPNVTDGVVAVSFTPYVCPVLFPWVPMYARRTPSHKRTWWGQGQTPLQDPDKKVRLNRRLSGAEDVPMLSEAPRPNHNFETGESWVCLRVTPDGQLHSIRLGRLALALDDALEVREAELTTDKTLNHPLPERTAEDADTVVPQLLCENGALDRVCAVEEPESPDLEPCRGFGGRGR